MIYAESLMFRLESGIRPEAGPVNPRATGRAQLPLPGPHGPVFLSTLCGISVAIVGTSIESSRSSGLAVEPSE